jgi:hypothetical protein
MLFIEKDSTHKTFKKEEENNTPDTLIKSNTPNRYITSPDQNFKGNNRKYNSDKDILSVDSHISVRKILRQINEI